MNSMTRLIVLSVICLGCLEQPTTTITPKPPVSLTLADAAERFVRDYAAGLADAAAEAASRANHGEFADVTAAEEFFYNATAAAREKANQPLAAAINKAFTDEPKKPGTTTVPLFSELAKGFGRIKPK